MPLSQLLVTLGGRAGRPTRKELAGVDPGTRSGLCLDLASAFCDVCAVVVCANVCGEMCIACCSAIDCGACCAGGCIC